jgi:hypothetical protein
MYVKSVFVEKHNNSTEFQQFQSGWDLWTDKIWTFAFQKS